MNEIRWFLIQHSLIVLNSLYYLVSSYIIRLKELIIINIEIKPRNKAQEIFHKIHDKLEDILFSIIQKIPERFIPAFIMDHIERYITKRTQELQQQITQQHWQQVYLEKAVEEIRSQQNKEKAPQED